MTLNKQESETKRVPDMDMGICGTGGGVSVA